MAVLRTFVVSLALLASALAAPTADLTTRQSATTCGSDQYTAAQVSAAASAACNYVSYGGYAGSSDYPHQYHDDEGFSFNGVQGPYYEFPIEESGVYTGGSPGADRVIINQSCQYAGTITHTGASSYDGFVGCSGTS